MPELVLVALLSMLAAVAVVQALVALFGTRGWMVALLLVVLQTASAGAWLPVETAPGFFRALHPLLPMTYAVEAFRTAMAGGAASLVAAALVLVAWTVAGLTVTLVAVRLRAGRTGMPREVVAA
jgi:putative membrane protein